MGSIGSVDGSYANGFLHRDFLLGSPDVAFGVGARHFRLERHHGDEFSRWIIGGLGRANAGVEEAAQGEHTIEAFSAVVTHFFAVIINVRRKRRGDCAEGFDATDQTVINDRAVLAAEAWTVAKAFFFQALINAHLLIAP